MATLIAELVGFLVILFVIYRFVWPLIGKMVAGRQQVIQQQVDDSEAAAQALAAAEKRFETAVAEARDEAARIRDDARADATRIREELTDQAEREVERIRQRGEEQLVALRDQVVRQLRAELGGLSMQLAERVVHDSLADEGRKSASVDHFLDQLEQISTDDGVESRQAVPVAGGAN
jgi:ATP synthase F0 subunit b